MRALLCMHCAHVYNPYQMAHHEHWHRKQDGCWKHEIKPAAAAPAAGQLSLFQGANHDQTKQAN